VAPAKAASRRGARFTIRIPAPHAKFRLLFHSLLYPEYTAHAPYGTPAHRPNQTLLFDADDTLWENNIYFERSIAAFISYLNHREFSPTRSAKCSTRSSASTRWNTDTACRYFVAPSFIASNNSLTVR